MKMSTKKRDMYYFHDHAAFGFPIQVFISLVVYYWKVRNHVVIIYFVCILQ